MGPNEAIQKETIGKWAQRKQNKKKQSEVGPNEVKQEGTL